MVLLINLATFSTATESFGPGISWPPSCKNCSFSLVLHNLLSTGPNSGYNPSFLPQTCMVGISIISPSSSHRISLRGPSPRTPFGSSGTPPLKKTAQRNTGYSFAFRGSCCIWWRSSEAASPAPCENASTPSKGPSSAIYASRSDRALQQLSRVPSAYCKNSSEEETKGSIAAGGVKKNSRCRAPTYATGKTKMMPYREPSV